MSTLNVNIINPESGTTVDVNGVIIKKEANKPLILWSGISQASTGNGTTIIGEESMIANTGNSNTAVGFGSSRDNTSGQSNTAIGHQALYENTTGNFNVAVGKDALFGSLSGLSNTAIGNQSLYLCKGDLNVGVGHSAGFSLTTGNQNTLLGAQAGNTITTGSNNIVIGHDAQPATPTTDWSITLGNPLNTVLRCAVTTITSLSDERDKKEIKDLSTGLEFVESLRPVEFVWDDRDEEGKHDIADFGFIAQDLKKAQEDVDKADVLKLVYEENPDKLEASYGKLVPILVKAIQELSEEVKQLKSK